MSKILPESSVVCLVLRTENRNESTKEKKQKTKQTNSATTTLHSIQIKTSKIKTKKIITNWCSSRSTGGERSSAKVVDAVVNCRSRKVGFIGRAGSRKDRRGSKSVARSLVVLATWRVLGWRDFRFALQQRYTNDDARSTLESIGKSGFYTWFSRPVNCRRGTALVAFQLIRHLHQASTWHDATYSQLARCYQEQNQQQ